MSFRRQVRRVEQTASPPAPPHRRGRAEQQPDDVGQSAPRTTAHHGDAPPRPARPGREPSQPVKEERFCRRESYDDGVAFERISVDLQRMGGVPTIRDLRVTVSMILGQLAGGRTIDELLADYPYLERDDVLAALAYAAAVVNQREVPVARPA